ncbi:MAG: PorT family protein [Bacteroidales bacterium]|nr:PorT family protein [Bacteroidales bacterium]
MTKKLLVAALLLAFTGMVASAQLRFGVTGGFTSSSTSLKNIKTSKASFYHAGLALQLGLPSGFAVQTGLLYQVKGTKAKGALSDSQATVGNFDVKYGYLELPLELQWGLDLILLRPYALVQGFLGYAVNEKVGELAGKAITHFGDSDFKSKLEYGYAVGFGIDIMKFQLAAKYFKNLGNLGPDVTVTSAAGQAIKNKDNFDGLAISLTVFF